MAEVSVSELILPLVNVGDQATLPLTPWAMRVSAVSVLRIHPTLSTDSRQAIVELTLDPIPVGARAGQFVRATLDTAAVARLLVPFPALRRDRTGGVRLAVGRQWQGEPPHGAQRPAFGRPY